MKICFLTPARTELKRGEPLNVLVGAEGAGESARCFRFFAETEGGWREIYAERRELKGESGPLHLYFTIPADRIAEQLRFCPAEELVFEGRQVRHTPTGKTVTLQEIACKSQAFNSHSSTVSASYTSPVSPPPFMVGMVEIELDKLTGQVTILDYMAVVDCGIPINPALARIQTEGGIVQGIGMALSESVTYTAKGRPIESNFMQYKVPTRLDMGKLRVEFEHSYEPTGPFGAKSIGEIVINTPSPALAHAIYRATGVWHRELPITPEKIAMSVPE